jgi:hypothetical protein
MNVKIFALIILLCTGLLSCSKNDDYNLSSSIFIEDTDFPGLPKYSEWGYNTFGAYIDRNPFVSTNEDIPSKVVVRNDTLQLILKGSYKGEFAEMIFMLGGYNPRSHSQLTALNGDTIDLKHSPSKVQFRTKTAFYNFDIIEGELIFKKVQRLYVDEVETKCIVSGYFQLKTFMNDEPVAISQGRFDLGIGYDNFFNLSLN